MIMNDDFEVNACRNCMNLNLSIESTLAVVAFELMKSGMNAFKFVGMVNMISKFILSTRSQMAVGTYKLSNSCQN